MPKYRIWEAFDGPFDKGRVNDPDLEISESDCRSHSVDNPTKAAIHFAEKNMRHNDIAVIVHDVHANTWFEIELVETWEADLYHPTSLEELSKPKPETAH